MVILILGVAALVGVKAVLPKLDDGSKQMVYLTDERLYYLKDMNKPDKAVEVDRVRNLDGIYNVSFSEDGTYLYYYSEVDTDDDVYTLSRIKVSKLKPNKNHDKYIEEVAADVKYYGLGNKNTIYYEDRKGRLICNKNGKETELVRDAYRYYLNEDKNVIYYVTRDDDQYEVGSVNISNGKDTVIDSGIDYVETVTEEGLFVYNKDDDLYVVWDTKDPVCIAKGISDILYVDDESGTVYYEYQIEEEKMLYDYVNDTYATEDDKIKEPEVRDGLVEISESEAFDAVMTDSMREEYLTGKKKDKKQYYDNLSYDEDMQMYYDFGVSTYDSYYYDDTAQKWYRYDESKYDEAYEKYASVEDRIELREELKNNTHTIYENKVCSASIKQSERVLCDGVQNVLVSSEGKLLLYGKIADELAKINMDDIEDADDVEAYLNETQSEATDLYYILNSGEEQKLELDGSVFISSVDGSNVVFSKYDDDKMALYLSQIKGDKLSTPTEVEKDVLYGASLWMNGVLYYYINYDSDDDVADICTYKDGKSSTIKKNVSISTRVSSDDRLVENDKDLKLYDMSGNETRVAKDVSSFSYLSRKQILYMSDDDLFLYTGSDQNIKIAKNVDSYITYLELQMKQEDLHGIVY